MKTGYGAINRMKKLISIFLTITIFTMLLTACGNAARQPEAVENSEAAGTAPVKPTAAQAAKYNEAIDSSRIRLTQFEDPSVSGEAAVVAVIATTEGDIRVRLFDAEAPKTVAAFTRLATGGYYDGNSFSEVVGGYKIDGTGKAEDIEYPENGEFSLNLWNFHGAVAISNNGTNFMIVTAKQCLNSRSELESINFPAPVVEKYLDEGGAPHQDWKNTVFGQVVDGMDVADRISEATEPVQITGITVGLV